MPVLEWDPGASPEAPGTLYFYEQGRDPSTGFQVTSGGVITGGATAAYTGATAEADVLTTKVTGDADPRFVVEADGTISWGDGSGATDVSIGRYAAGGLEIDGALRFTNGQLLFRADGSVNLYSNAANTLHTDDNLDVDGTLTVDGAVGVASAVTSTRSAAADVVLGAIVTADTFDRFRIQAGGAQEWGPGNGARDTGLSRGAANRLDVTTASLRIATAGRGLQVAEGANATMGTATLVAGTATVNTTAVTANSRIFLTAQTTGGGPGALRISARSAGTSFTITSTSGTDTSSVAWWIVEPAT